AGGLAGDGEQGTRRPSHPRHAAIYRGDGQAARRSISTLIDRWWAGSKRNANQLKVSDQRSTLKHRQLYDGARATARGIAEDQATAVGFGHAARDGEPQSSPARAPVAGGFQS